MIEKYVVSLDLAKKLKEAGWEKKTEFIWARGFVDLSAFKFKYEGEEVLPAPLAEEILEELPKKIIDDKTYRLRIEKYDDHYAVGYCYDYLFSYQQGKNAIVESVLRWLKLITDSNISNALARLWLWLKENGYLEENDNVERE